MIEHALWVWAVDQCLVTTFLTLSSTIFANHILKITEYAKFTQRISPFYYHDLYKNWNGKETDTSGAFKIDSNLLTRQSVKLSLPKNQEKAQAFTTPEL